MAKRLYLRAGEVPVLFGEDSSKSEWKLWNDMTQGQDGGVSEYGRWQGRLGEPIMRGIAEDFRLRIERPLEQADQSAASCIMPPKSWAVGPSMITGGRPCILVVQQKTGQSLRDWKEPGQMPPKHLRRMHAIATAYGVEDVLLGVLVDGYSSKLFHITATAEIRDEISRRAQAFVKLVEIGEAPDVDFSEDETVIRQGIAIAKTEAATDMVEALLNERASLVSRQAPLDASIKQLEARLRVIETHLIHMAGSSGKLEVGTRLVTVFRDGKNVPKVQVIDRQEVPLF